MTGIINKTRFLERTVLYHEKKVQDKTATFLDAGFYLQDPELLTIEQKLARLSERMLLNERCKVNVMTFSMHFDQSDQLSARDLKRIASVFLKEFGFDRHPYLLYEHHDTLHKHMHVVTTLIRADGSRIHDKFMTVALLHKAQRAIESQFGLKNPNTPSKISQLKGVENTFLKENKSRLYVMKTALAKVLKDYRFSTFSEYNALLRQFGVQASKGRQNSYLFKVGGLVYRTVDSRGRATCKAVKASSLEGQATLKALYRHFDRHRQEQTKQLSRLSNTLDLALLDQQVSSLNELAGVLESKGIKIHVTRQRNQTESKLVYIDNRTLCAFDADKLGEKYQLKGLYKRCGKLAAMAPVPNMPLSPATDSAAAASAYVQWPEALDPSVPQRQKTDALLHDLFMPAWGFDQAPLALRKPYKKRKRKTSR